MIAFKNILSSIADVGQKLFKRSIVEVKKNDYETIMSLCDDLLSNKGAAFGITVARDILLLYQDLNLENKLKFFLEINNKYKTNLNEIDNAITEFKKSNDEKNRNKLFRVTEGKRRELFNRLNMAPNGISIIVSLREDLLNFINENSELESLDNDLRYLFRSWFNPGFLKLKTITWDTKAAILEKIIEYEKVHQMKDMNDLKRRLGEDRKFFSYFHPALDDEPIIFVEVALTKGLGKSIQEIMKPAINKEKNYDTATFYSISNCQEGLSRVTLGNFLIKRVVYELQEELPNIKNYGTLSPIPGFAKWVRLLDENKLKEIVGNLSSQNLSFLKDENLKVGDNRIVAQKEAITKLAAHYIMKEKNKKGLPINDVSRFHLGNGAIVDDIIINANISEVGYKRSFGTMVNYLYELKTIEQNHEEYMNTQKVICSNKLNKYL